METLPKEATLRKLRALANFYRAAAKCHRRYCDDSSNLIEAQAHLGTAKAFAFSASDLDDVIQDLDEDHFPELINQK